MPLSSISTSRSLTSYAAIQALVARLIRNRRFQLSRQGVKGVRYLDVGCGPNIHAGFINLDFLWRPGINLCWDITRGLPFAAGAISGIFSEHCLEHFPLETGGSILREMRRVLDPGGIARIVVPDGGLYLQVYQRQQAGDLGEPFPFQEIDQKRRPWTPMLSVNRIFYQDRESLFGHRTIYDFDLLRAALKDAGFQRIDLCSFQQGRDPRLLVDSPNRRIESLYVEAS